MKNVKFPLVMAGGKQVRELDDLQEYFDLQKAIEYFCNGKLQKWLENTYNDDILEEIQKLTGEEEDFVARFTDALGVECEPEEVDVHILMKKSVLREKLKKCVPEEKIEEYLPFTADSQETLMDRLREGHKKIYLLGEKFSIPENAVNVHFVGIEKTEHVELEAKERKRFLKQKLRFTDVIPEDEETRKIISCDELGDCMLELLSVLEMQLRTEEKE